MTSDGEPPDLRDAPASAHALRIVADDARASRSEGEQSAADADQSSADGDQTAADRDQDSSDRDQAAADRDQAASDRDLASGGDLDTHEATKDVRDSSAAQRTQSSQSRLESAARRDEIARRRDAAAAERDLMADAQDRAMAQADAAEDRAASARGAAGGQLARAAARRRAQAAALRAEAAAARQLAARDREAAARDRTRAARERLQAHTEHERLHALLVAAETDQLTGARVRSAGLDDLSHELDRCRRAGTPLVVAYVDVVGLKTTNDSEGHAAGDALLQRVVREIRNHLRSYDLVVRLGGDEFLCAMSDATISDARARLDAIDAALARAPGRRAIRAGFAEAADDDGVAQLVSRADAEMLKDTRADLAGVRSSAPNAVRRP